MKKIKIFIAKEAVFDDVSLNSEYAGLKSPSESPIYDRVATVSEDSQLLSGFLTLAFGELIRKLRSFVVSSSCDGASVSLDLEVSGAYDESMTPSLKEDIFRWLVTNVSGHWFRLTLPDRTAEWENLSAELLASIESKLCARRKPSRTNLNSSKS